METVDTNARIAVLENDVKILVEVLKEIKQEQKEQHNTMMEKIEDLEKKMNIIERWRWMIIGGSAVLGYLVAHMQFWG